MNRWRAFCETVHLAALGLWLGFVLASGTFAAILFPTMRQSQPTLPDFSAWPGEHWIIAAGRVGNRVFFAVDIAQFTFAMLSGFTFVALIAFLGLPRTRPATLIRATALGVAMACAASQVIIVGPKMNSLMTRFWAAASEGQITAAEMFKSEFDRTHPIGSGLLYGSCISVFIALIAGLWSVTRGGSVATSTSPGNTSPAYEEPALLKARRV